MWGDDATALVLDDNRGCRELHQYWLEGEFTVETAADGSTALKTLEDGSFDLLVLDRKMPELSGIEILRRLESVGFDGYVLIVTGVEPEFEMVDLPIDEYLVKPVSEDEVLSAVERLSRRDSYHAQLRELFSLATKKARLEVELSGAELTSSPEYQRLTEALEREREAIKQAVSDDDVWLTAIEACCDREKVQFNGGMAARGHEI